MCLIIILVRLFILEKIQGGMGLFSAFSVFIKILISNSNCCFEVEEFLLL